MIRKLKILLKIHRKICGYISLKLSHYLKEKQNVRLSKSKYFKEQLNMQRRLAVIQN